MSNDPHRIALERRKLARRAVNKAAAVSERLLEVHRRALKLLGPGADDAVPEIDERMRLIERRMLDVEQAMRAAERNVPVVGVGPPAADEEKG